MVPNGVVNGHPEVYSKDCPGCNTGCSPTTPGPRTSSTFPFSSVMTQCRLINCTVSEPSFEIFTVYKKNHCFCCGCERVGSKRDCTRTRTPWVTASEVNTTA